MSQCFRGVHQQGLAGSGGVPLCTESTSHAISACRSCAPQVWRRARQRVQRTAMRWQLAGRSQAFRTASSQWLRNRLFGGRGAGAVSATSGTAAIDPIGSPTSAGVSEGTSMFSPLRESLGGAYTSLCSPDAAESLVSFYRSYLTGRFVNDCNAFL